MRKKKTKKGHLFLLVPGLCLMALALSQLLRAPDLLQYVAQAPQPVAVQAESAGDEQNGTEEEDREASPGDAPEMTHDALNTLDAGLAEAMNALAGSLTAHAVSAEKSNVAMAGDAGGSANARLMATGEGYFGVYPKYLLSGRLPSSDELKYGDPVIVLDIDLAIKLFAVSEPIDRKVTIEEHAFRVVGVVRHSRSSGEHDLYSAYIPLAAACKRGMALSSVTASALAAPKSGAASTFQAALSQVMPDGDFYDIAKEALRARVLLRLVAASLAAFAIGIGFSWINRFSREKFFIYRERMRREYLRDMLPGVTAACLLALGGYALLLGASWAVAMYAIEPVYIFPEWVPAVLVELSDIKATFWDLITRASKPVRRYTVEGKEIEFYAMLLRWGMIASLTGALMGALGRTSKILRARGEEESK